MNKLVGGQRVALRAYAEQPIRTYSHAEIRATVGSVSAARVLGRLHCLVKQGRAPASLVAAHMADLVAMPQDGPQG